MLVPSHARRWPHVRPPPPIPSCLPNKGLIKKKFSAQISPEKVHPLKPCTRGSESSCSTPLQSYGSSSRHARPDWLNCARTVNAHTGRTTTLLAGRTVVGMFHLPKQQQARACGDALRRAPSTSRCRRLSRVSFRTAQSIYERLSAGCAPRTHTTASLLPVSAFSHRDLRAPRTDCVPARTRCFRNSSWRRSQI